MEEEGPLLAMDLIFCELILERTMGAYVMIMSFYDFTS